MHPLVRDVYKRILVVGRDYPMGLDYVREKAKEAFYKEAHLTADEEIKRAVHRGRWMVKEMIGVIQLKKYRTMNARYTPAEMRMLLRNLHEEAAARMKDQEEEGGEGV
ncbi:unnamed protein product [Aphanomyces euteiches]|uniref:Uncharacterized protein n=1 Tax=Aphanomyces euteiches TaxID=100861 RepID=A0A6G0WG47_9STRA|nr:hypothetical protein Ae201684_015965 [Aphanomyces euteiches]KAG9398353.1 LYR motif-containing protein 5 [Aphanomyces cochlioides]KAH9088314.1 hypothetical protein Ae201684P_003008 [Aphanomyces euteiches]KAH9138277.1 hypothetical protein AeRB84_017398 [Aphanomyces euteiches]KAH9182481.1 hypothetical protein AeNC1_015546 [Aphanomyces euteiches]